MRELIGKADLFIAKKKPTILAVVGIIGVGVTAFVAFRNGMKAERILMQNPPETKELTVADKMKKIAVPCILPVVATVAGVSAAIARAEVIHSRREKALSIVTNRSEEKLSTLTQTIASATGSAAAEVLVKDPDRKASDGKFMFYEPYSATWFESTLAEVLEAEYHLNRNFILRGYISMDEVYAFFGLPNVSTWDMEYIGWSYYNGDEDGYQWVDFVNREKTDENGDLYYIIEYPFSPRYLFEDK